MAAAHAYEMGLFARLLMLCATCRRCVSCPRRRVAARRCRSGSTGSDPARTAEILGDQKICVFSGDYYAAEYFTAMGLRESGGAVRAGLYHYTTADDVDQLVAAVAQVR